MKSLWLCLVAVFLISCGGATSTTPPPPQNASVAGQWDAIATPTNTTFGFANYYVNITDQGGGNFFAPAGSLILCSSDNCGFGAFSQTGTLTGTVAGQNVSATLGTATLSGTVSADGSTMSGSYTDTSAAGNGTWKAQRRPAVTGTYSGSFNSTVHPSAIPGTLTASLTQASDLSVTGTATVSNSTCFTTLTFGAGGRAVGGAVRLVASNQPITIEAIPNENGTLSLTSPYYGSYQITAGLCGGDNGTWTATKQ